jgi:hypothetical protein
MDGKGLPRPVNSDVVKKYYAWCIYLYQAIKLKFDQDFFSVFPLKSYTWSHILIKIFGNSKF